MIEPGQVYLWKDDTSNEHKLIIGHEHKTNSGWHVQYAPGDSYESQNTPNLWLDTVELMSDRCVLIVPKPEKPIKSRLQLIFDSE